VVDAISGEHFLVNACYLISFYSKLFFRRPSTDINETRNDISLIIQKLIYRFHRSCYCISRYRRPAPLKLRPYGAIQMCILSLLPNLLRLAMRRLWLVGRCYLKSTYHRMHARLRTNSLHWKLLLQVRNSRERSSLLDRIACTQYYAAYCYRYVARSVVGWSVCVLGIRVSCAKTAEPIASPFWGWHMWVQGTMYFIIMEPSILHGKYHFWGDMSHVPAHPNMTALHIVRLSPPRGVTRPSWRCGLLPNYFGHLLPTG